jgi:hypothetical protein
MPALRGGVLGAEREGHLPDVEASPVIDGQLTLDLSAIHGGHAALGHDQQLEASARVVDDHGMLTRDGRVIEVEVTGPLAPHGDGGAVEGVALDGTVLIKL